MAHWQTDLDASWHLYEAGAVQRWYPPPADRPEITGAIEISLAQTYLSNIALRLDAYEIRLATTDTRAAGTSGFDTGPDLSSIFEIRGRIWIGLLDSSDAVTNSFLLNIADLPSSDRDSTEQYNLFIPSSLSAKQAEFAAFRSAIATTSATQKARLILWDGVGTNPIPSMTAPTVSVSIAADDTSPTAGDTVTWTATVTGTATGAITYQWQSLSGSTWSNISGATSSTYSRSLASAGTVTVRCRATRQSVTATSAQSAVTWTAAGQPTLTVGTATVSNASPTVGSSVTFTCPTPGGTATGAITYQWQRLVSGSWTDISGATSRTYARTESSAGTVTVRCEVTRAGLTRNSGQVAATWSAAPVTPTVSVAITADDTSPTAGDTVTWTAAVTGTATGAITYQWQSFSNGSWSNISGATSSTYSRRLANAGSLTVRCRATRQGVTATSAQSAVTWTAAIDTGAWVRRTDLTGPPGTGQEYIFTAKANSDPITGAANLPLASWRYDDSRLPITRGSQTYYDGTPGNLTQDRPWLIRFRRRVPGSPAANANIGSVAWTQETAFRAYGIQGPEGDPATARGTPIFRLRLTAVQAEVWADDDIEPGDTIGNTTIIGYLNDAVTGSPESGDWVQVTGEGVAEQWVTYDGSSWSRATDDLIATPAVRSIDISAVTGDFANLQVTGVLQAASISPDVFRVRNLYFGQLGSNARFENLRFAEPAGDIDALLILANGSDNDTPNWQPSLIARVSIPTSTSESVASNRVQLRNFTTEGVDVRGMILAVWGLSSEGEIRIIGVYDPAKDFNTLFAAGNREARQLWSDGTTMWVNDNTDDKIYAYNLATKARDSAKDFNTLAAAGNTSPGGLWSDGTTMWVTDSRDDKIYAYNLATKARDSAKDFNTLVAAGNTVPVGLWSDGTTMWVTDQTDGKIYAYDLATKARDSAKDFNTLAAAGNTSPNGLWSDGTTMWVPDSRDDKIYAYNLATKARDSAKDLNTLLGVGNAAPTGLWSDGTTMWVIDATDNKIYAYTINLPDEE